MLVSFKVVHNLGQAIVNDRCATNKHCPTHGPPLIRSKGTAKMATVKQPTLSFSVCIDDVTEAVCLFKYSLWKLPVHGLT